MGGAQPVAHGAALGRRLHSFEPRHQLQQPILRPEVLASNRHWPSCQTAGCFYRIHHQDIREIPQIGLEILARDTH